MLSLRSKPNEACHLPGCFRHRSKPGNRRLGHRRGRRTIHRAGERLEDSFDVAVDAHLGEDGGDTPVLINDEGRALDAQETAAVERFLLVDAVRLRYRRVRVAEEGKGEVELLGEPLVGRRVVAADPQDHNAGLGERRKVILEAAGLPRAAGRVVLGIEVEHDGFAPQVGECHRMAVSRLEGEVRRRISDGE